MSLSPPRNPASQYWRLLVKVHIANVGILLAVCVVVVLMIVSILKFVQVLGQLAGKGLWLLVLMLVTGDLWHMTYYIFVFFFRSVPFWLFLFVSKFILLYAHVQGLSPVRRGSVIL